MLELTVTDASGGEDLMQREAYLENLKAQE